MILRLVASMAAGAFAASCMGKTRKRNAAYAPDQPHESYLDIRDAGPDAMRDAPVESGRRSRRKHSCQRSARWILEERTFGKGSCDDEKTTGTLARRTGVPCRLRLGDVPDAILCDGC